MFGHTYKVLTEASNHYIDWSRTGELVTSETHHYNQRELLIRGAMAAFVTASVVLSAYLNNPEKTGCGDLTVALVSGVLGLAIAHIPIVYPLFKKRQNISMDCEEIIARINETLATHPISQQKRDDIADDIQAIMSLSLSNDEHANASLTWGTRKSMLMQLEKQIDEHEYDDERLDSGMNPPRHP